MKAKIFMADGFEETEAVVIIDLLRRADFELDIVSIMGKKEVEGGHGIKIVSDTLIENEKFDDIDLLLIPGGGGGVGNLSNNQTVLNIIKDFNKKKKYIGAICAGPKVLDKAGILKNRTLCCYPGVEKELLEGNVIFKNVCVDNNLITSRAVGTAIEMGLKIVEILVSKNASENLKKKIVYDI